MVDLSSLNSLVQIELDQSKSFFIGICLSDPSANQFHSFAIYRFDNKLFKGEVGWHNWIKKEEFDQKNACSLEHANTHFWVLPNLPEDTLHVLAAAFDEILDMNMGILPYSIIAPNDIVFDEKSQWFGPKGHGLTCSSLILSLFRYQNIPFIDISTWEQRSTDKKWYQKIIDLLKQTSFKFGIEPEHITVQQSILAADGSVEGAILARVKPSDISAAASVMYSENTPLSYEVIDPVSTRIEQFLFFSSMSEKS